MAEELLSLMGASRFPMTPGNDFAGVVAAVGSGRASGFAIRRARLECDFEDPNTEGPSPWARFSRCGGQIYIVEIFDGAPARSPSPTRIRIDTS